MKYVALLAILALAICQQSCPVYDCLNINNHNRHGVQILCGQNSTDGSGIYSVDDDCDPGYICELNQPDFLFGLKAIPQYSFCELNNATSYNETRFPGDVCEYDNQCMGNSFCLNGICNVTNPNVGAPCEYSSECAAGQYCASDNTCERTKPTGALCTNSIQCEWADGCMQNLVTKESRCTQMLSVASGTEIAYGFYEKYCYTNNAK